MLVSEIGFGAWAIGGPVQVGGIPIGWGQVNDQDSVAAIRKALDYGINFFDTADFYGLGHSEEILGQELWREKDVFIATKVGQKKGEANDIIADYSYHHIIGACENSLRRLKRDYIDYYQLHTAKLHDLQNGEATGAMQQLQKDGKIRYWGTSLSTFQPDPEADYLLEHGKGYGLQVVLNILNQISLPIIRKSGKRSMGIIARMPFQFGLLTGKFTATSHFQKDDHRSFRLTKEIIEKSEKLLSPVWTLLSTYQTTKVGLSLAYVLSYPEVSTVIPGIRTREQVQSIMDGLVSISVEDRNDLKTLFDDSLKQMMPLLQAAG